MVTPIVLYRKGNSSSPRMDNVRPNKDITIYENQGQNWVTPTLQGEEPPITARPGGISTFDSPGAGRNWWKLDAGTVIPPELELVNDRPGHWLFQPSRAMPLEEYQQALRLVGDCFCRVE